MRVFYVKVVTYSSLVVSTTWLSCFSYDHRPLTGLSPVAISAIFCPAESPGGVGGMSYTAARFSVAIDAIIASGTARFA